MRHLIKTQGISRPKVETGIIKLNLAKKYMASKDYFYSRVTSDIMYNEPRNLVSIFKDYLIYDDFSEYLKREYLYHEVIERMPRIFDFYDKYSKVFPNYVALPREARYLFKNIERKQKLIDTRNRRVAEKEEKKKRGTPGKPKTSMLITSEFRAELTDAFIRESVPADEGLADGYKRISSTDRHALEVEIGMLTKDQRISYPEFSESNNDIPFALSNSVQFN